MKLAGFPRIRITHAPTPLEPMPRLTELLGGPQLWVKRDDCTGLATGGNKTRSYPVLLPTEAELEQAILLSIRHVKEGNAARAGALLAPAVQALIDRGAAAVVLACTETPVALDAIGSPLRAHCVDSNRALARSCVARWLALEEDQPAALRSA